MVVVLLILIVFLFCVGILMLKYLDGDFDYTDRVIEVINKKDINGYVFLEYIIERKYTNGKIKIIYKK